MRPFVLTIGEGRQASIDIDGAVYLAKVVSQGWWLDEGRPRDVRIELIIDVRSPELVKSFGRQFDQ